MRELLAQNGQQVFPCWMRFDNKKGAYRKGVALPEGVSWKTVDPLDPSLNWSSGVYGIQVPENVVILDIDAHKGVTLDDVEAFLGVTLNWAAAKLQTTPSGGAHYAFKITAPARQSQNWIEGFDTRAAGQGFICSGTGYSPCGLLGVAALINADLLPLLPAGTPLDIEQPTNRTAATPQPTGRDETTLIAALRHIDPTNREEWLKVGMGLRSYYADDENAGFEVFDAWSRGDYWPDGCPASYVAETQELQWSSFKPEKSSGGPSIHIGTVFDLAIKSGWSPQSRVDVAAAFAALGGDAAEYDKLVDDITEIASNPKKVVDVVSMIQKATATPVQKAMLGSLFKRQLKEDGLMTKELSAALSALIGPPKGAAPHGTYSTNHAENAHLYMSKCHPNGTLIRVNQNWYLYTGKCWAEVEDEFILQHLTLELSPISPQNSTVNGTLALVSNLAYKAGVKMGEQPTNYVIMQNGILDIATRSLLPHSQLIYSTNIMPYEYDPTAKAPQWLKFLDEITEGDRGLIDLLQEWFGYMITTDYRHQKILFILGPRRCGKGTIGKVLKDFVGEINFAGASVDSLMDNKFLETLPEKTVFFDGDVPKKFANGVSTLVSTKLKKISGCDPIQIPRLYKKSLTAELPTRITLAGNNVPALFDDSDALAGRIIVLPLYKSFFGREDLTLANRLRAELPGIANWALDGLDRLNLNGKFTQPQSSLEEGKQLSEQYSSLKMYVEYELTLGGSEFISGAALHDHYVDWSTRNGEDRILSRRQFSISIKDLTRGSGVRSDTARVGGTVTRGFTGIAITRDIKDAVVAAFKQK